VFQADCIESHLVSISVVCRWCYIGTSGINLGGAGGATSVVGSDSDASGNNSGGVVPIADSDGTTSTGGGAHVQDQAGKVNSRGRSE